MSEKPVYMLAFALHPHDAELGISGTVTPWTKEGKDVIFVTCTNGDKGSLDPIMKPETLAQIRE